MKRKHYFDNLTLAQCNMLLGRVVMLHWERPCADPELRPEIGIVKSTDDGVLEIDSARVRYSANMVWAGRGVSFDFDPPWEAPAQKALKKDRSAEEFKTRLHTVLCDAEIALAEVVCALSDDEFVTEARPQLAQVGDYLEPLQSALRAARAWT